MYTDKNILIDLGEIYIITNIGENNEKGWQYIGQAPKLRKNLAKWGTEGRWNSHLSQVKNKDFRCRLLHKSIDKFGADSFKVEKLYDCLKINMDDLEKYNIIKFNTLSPNGYNLNEGGIDGKDSEETLILKNKPKVKDIVDTVEKKTVTQNAKKIRKNTDDEKLPKYLLAIRNGDTITGYRVEGVPTLKTIPKYFPQKTFSNNNGDSLEDAKKYLNELLSKQNSENLDDNLDLNKYIKKIQKSNSVLGYIVTGLTDNFNNIIPDRIFDNKTDDTNLYNAEKYINEVNYIKENNIQLLDNNWLIVEPTKPNKVRHNTFYIPNYVNPIFNKDTKLIQGFTVQGIPMFDKDKKPILDENGKQKKLSEKKFTKQGIKKKIVTITPEMNYKEAIKYLLDSKIKCNII